MRALAAVAIALFVAVAARGQNAASERVEVTLVEVPVNVTSADGEPIRGLTKENFALFDDGEKREITHFEVVDFAARALQPREQQMLASGPARRNFMLLFDLSNSSPFSLKRARAAALVFIGKQLLPGDRLAVATIGLRQGFQLQAPFSTDRKLANQAVQNLGQTQFQSASASDPLRIAIPGLQSGESNVWGVDSTSPEELSSEADHIFERMNVIRQLKEFATLGRVLDRVAGRKEVILLSEGFGAEPLQGRRGVPSNIQQQQRAAIESGAIWVVPNTDVIYGNTGAQNALTRMVNALRRSDVILNAIDIKGLRGPFDLAGGASNDSLHIVAHGTGGRVYKNDNDLQNDFRRMLKAQEVTYILAFERSGDEDRFHKLKVRVVNVPRARVRHRVGYYSSKSTVTDYERMLTAGEIMLNSLPVNDLKVAARAVSFRTASDRAEVPVIVEVDGKSLLHDAKGPVLSTEFFIYAFDDKELIRDFTGQKVELDLSKTRDRLTRRGVKFYGTLTLPSGDYTIRTLVRQGSRNGFVSVPLHVPDAGVPEAAITLHDPADWLLVRGAQRDGTQLDPFLLGETEIIPAVSPVLANGSYQIAVAIHELTVDRLTVSSHIDGPPGTAQDVPLELVGRTSADIAGGVRLLFRFSPPALARGDYSLVLDLRDETGKKEQRATLPFHVN